MRNFVLVILALGTCAALGYWFEKGRAVDVRDAADETVQCMSYAPFRMPGQSAKDPNLIIPPSQIEADLAILSRRTDCVRTYSVSNGLSEVPRIARKYNMQVIMGLWIGRDKDKNEEQIRIGLDVLQHESGSIRAVIVGNEVLLRGEQPVAQLRHYIDRVRETTSLPVSYADVWEYWVRHPEVAGSTTFVTVHILPYWENDPAPINRAIEHVQWAYKTVQERFPGHDILIGETGWPSAGRNRHGAQPGMVNQARFIREFSLTALAAGMRYNIIEAFDQPWKRVDEGTVGGYWGMYSAEGKAKYAFFGPVQEEPLWMQGLLAAGIGSALLAGFALLRDPRPSPSSFLALALGGGITGAVAAAQWFAFERGAADQTEWLVIGLYTILVPWVGIRLSQAIARWVDTGRIARPATAAAFARWFSTNARTYRSLERALGVLRFLFLFGAAVVCALHVLDPRYRDFPLAMIVLPATGYAFIAALGIRGAHFADDIRAYAEIEERLFAWWLIPAAISISVREGMLNPQAQWWAAFCLLFAMAVLVPDWRLRAQRKARQSHHA